MYDKGEMLMPPMTSPRGFLTEEDEKMFLHFLKCLVMVFMHQKLLKTMMSIMSLSYLEIHAIENEKCDYKVK